MTLQAALDAFKDIRDTAISTEAKRKYVDISTDWQSINTNMTLYYNTISSGDTTAANVYITEIIAILAGYDLTVDLPVQFPLSLSLITTPDTIPITVTAAGVDKPNSYTNASCTISVFIGGVDDSTNWTVAVTGNTNTSSSVLANVVSVTNLSSDFGTVSLSISKANYTTITSIISVYRVYDGQATVDASTVDGTSITLNGESKITATLIDVNETDSTYVINNTSGSDISNMSLTASNNVELNLSFDETDDWTVGSELEDNIILNGLPFVSALSDHNIKNCLISSPKGHGTFPFVLDYPLDLEGAINISLPPISGGNTPGNKTLKMNSDQSVGIGWYPNLSNRGSTVFGVTDSRTGVDGLGIVRDSGDANSYDSPFTSIQKTYQVLETWTEAIIKGSVDLVFGSTSALKIFYIDRGEVFQTADDISSINCKNNTFTNATNSIFVADSKIKILGRDLVSDDTFFTEITFLNINGVVTDVTVVKTQATGTLIGSTIAFSATTLADLIPEVTSTSSNPCKWVGFLNIDDMYSNY